MTANVLAIAGGLSRVGVPALPVACRGRWWGFRFRGPCLLYDLRLSGRSVRVTRSTVGPAVRWPGVPAYRPVPPGGPAPRFCGIPSCCRSPPPR